MQNFSGEITDVFYEAVIREQLKRMLPDSNNVDITFCAYLMANQIKGYQLDPNFNGGKC